MFWDKKKNRRSEKECAKSDYDQQGRGDNLRSGLCFDFCDEHLAVGQSLSNRKFVEVKSKCPPAFNLLQ